MSSVKILINTRSTRECTCMVRDKCNDVDPQMACKTCIQPCGRFLVSRQAITPARWCVLMTVGMMADRSSVMGITREYQPDWSFSKILCMDFVILQWVRIAKVELHYNKTFCNRLMEPVNVYQLEIAADQINPFFSH